MGTRQLIAERIEDKPRGQIGVAELDGGRPLTAQNMTLEEIDQRMGQLFDEWNSEKFETSVFRSHSADRHAQAEPRPRFPY